MVNLKRVSGSFSLPFSFSFLTGAHAYIDVDIWHAAYPISTVQPLMYCQPLFREFQNKRAIWILSSLFATVYLPIPSHHLFPPMHPIVSGRSSTWRRCLAHICYCIDWIHVRSKWWSGPAS